MKPQIVIDTKVLFAALRSQLGAAHRLLSLIDSGTFEVNLSIPLLLEYEEVLKDAAGAGLALSISDIDDILDYLCRVTNLRSVSYLWRPFLNDRDDDMVLEVAFAAQSAILITYNKSDFTGAEQLGVRLLTPREFLLEIGALP